MSFYMNRAGATSGLCVGLAFLISSCLADKATPKASSGTIPPPREERLLGRVIDSESGTPLAGVRLLAFDDLHFEPKSAPRWKDVYQPTGGEVGQLCFGWNPFETTTDHEGYFRLRTDVDLPLRIRIRHKDYAPKVTRVWTPRNWGTIDVGDIKLERPASFSGLVHGQEGESLARCLVELQPAEVARYWSRKKKITDSEGRFRIEGIAPGRFKLRITQENPQTEEIVTVERELHLAPGENCQMDLRLDPQPLMTAARNSVCDG